ncbi:diacylglycerol kinase family protein [Clostridium sp.]|uniref:diacylglycerol/lipid kinase family protein n=1 Tax=Clostridium sp. TaxID=1506 RepID=UPI002FC75148
MRYLFIINPIAGNGKGLTYIDKIQDYFKDKSEEFKIELTEYKNHAEEIAREYSCRNDYHIFAVGGDGTINEVLNGLIGTNSILSIIPCGTGNDFVKTLYQDFDIENYISKLVEGCSTYIDLAKVNNRYYLNISSVGFDAEVAYNVTKFKHIKFLPGSISYLLSVLYTAFKFRALDLEIHLDSKVINQKTFLLASSNGKCYGGGFFITPEASIFDGKLDICNIKEVSLFKLLTSIGKALKGDIKHIKEVSYSKCEKVIISSSNEFTLNVDGELLRTNHADFKIIPKGIKVMLPSDATVPIQAQIQESVNF